jgi:hypothetical protein
MIKIEDNAKFAGKKFKVTFSSPGSGLRGYSVYAADLDEVHEAINHHHNHGPRAGQHDDGRIDHCPLCRQMRDEGHTPAKAVPMLRLVSAD